ncbi:MAG TPA: hypothetical protein PKY82_17775 [Pyrinomonadaceae bacterium]|nr:hypothetical protein [Pyrinomonadaceae bacterium]
MNYQMCKNCGLANALTAQLCVRCNFRLDSPINQVLPQKTAETLGGQINYAAAAPKKEKNNLYLILGGLAALVLVGGLFIGAVAIGYLVYSAKTNVARVENTNKPSTPYPVNSRPTPSDKSTPADKPKTIFGDEELAAVFMIKKQVGRFTHLSTFPAADSPDKKTFQNSGGEAKAMYGSKDKNADIIYCIASYSSSETAQAEFKNFIAREKQNGAKMIVDIMMDSQNKSINASYRIGVLTVLTFCSWKMETATMCHRIASPQGTSVVDFHNSWFNIK